jgi:hypothetical protein
MFLFIALLSLIAAGVISTAYFFFVLLLTLAAYILYALGCYRMFQKAGVTGILAWIPIVNTYFSYKIAWNSVAFGGYLISDIISNFKHDGHKTFLAWVFGIVAVVINFLYTQKLSKAFGKSEFFGLGLFFFEPIFIMIIGFGDAQYLGPQN